MFLKPCAAQKKTKGDPIDSTEASSSMVLKPCSSQKTTMEVSVDSCPTKRKAELDPEDDEIEEETEVAMDYLKAPEWDVDSFDGLEYYSSPEPEPFSDADEGALEEYRDYKREIIESKGFYVNEELTPGCRYRRIYPVPLDLEAFPGFECGVCQSCER